MAEGTAEGGHKPVPKSFKSQVVRAGAAVLAGTVLGLGLDQRPEPASADNPLPITTGTPSPEGTPTPNTIATETANIQATAVAIQKQTEELRAKQDAEAQRAKAANELKILQEGTPPPTPTRGPDAIAIAVATQIAQENIEREKAKTPSSAAVPATPTTLSAPATPARPSPPESGRSFSIPEVPAPLVLPAAVGGLVTLVALAIFLRDRIPGLRRLFSSRPRGGQRTAGGTVPPSPT